MLSLLRQLFHRQRSQSVKSATTAGYVLIEEMSRRAVPALAIDHHDSPTGSRLGGLPTLSRHHVWPSWREVPLAFLAELDCASIRQAGGPDWLPNNGMLFFFYHPDQETWGFDPQDRGSWAVIHDRNGREQEPIEPPAALAPTFPEIAVDFRLVDSVPDPDRISKIGPDAPSDAEWDDIYHARTRAFGNGPRHQISGFPIAVQNDNMELECQLASNGIYVGNPEGYASPEARMLSAAADEWRLLLQLDTDDATDMMWGDVGTLYFWIRESDARAGNFAAAWMVLQCS